MQTDIQKLIADVQFNCDVADAHFAGHYTLCTYLLKMRELYRWSQAIDQDVSLSSSAVSKWVEQKEALWNDLDNEKFCLLSIAGESYDPFDVAAINHRLTPLKLVYGAGYGVGFRPQFFIASLQHQEQYPAYDILISDHEYARDLATPVAMSQGRMIYIRQASLRRMLWEQIESWRWARSPATHPLAYLLADFSIDHGQVPDEIDQLQIEYAINHEIGEMTATQMLGEEWSEMLMQSSGSRLEWVARAIKDHLADALVTLPEIIQSRNPAAVHLYFANFSALRKQLFPQLFDAYQIWRESDSLVLSRMIAKAHAHWYKQARQLLQCHARGQLAINDDNLGQFQPEFGVC